MSDRPPWVSAPFEVSLAKALREAATAGARHPNETTPLIDIARDQLARSHGEVGPELTHPGPYVMFTREPVTS